MKRVQGLIISTLLYLSFASSSAFAITVDENTLSYDSNGNVIGISLPNIRPLDTPNIYNDTNVRWSMGRRGGRLTAWSGWGANMYLTAGLIDGDPTNPDIYTISYNSFRLSANFDGAGNFIGGSLIIRGIVSGSDISGKGTLVTADLSSFDYDSGLGLIGFNTENLQCYISGIHCTTSESVYLKLEQLGFSTYLRRYSSSALAVTNLPLPAAVWLFGVGLIGLVGISRRKKMMTRQVIAV